MGTHAGERGARGLQPLGTAFQQKRGCLSRDHPQPDSVEPSRWSVARRCAGSACSRWDAGHFEADVVGGHAVAERPTRRLASCSGRAPRPRWMPAWVRRGIGRRHVGPAGARRCAIEWPGSTRSTSLWSTASGRQRSCALSATWARSSPAIAWSRRSMTHFASASTCTIIEQAISRLWRPDPRGFDPVLAAIVGQRSPTARSPRAGSSGWC